MSHLTCLHFESRVVPEVERRVCGAAEVISDLIDYLFLVILLGRQLYGEESYLQVVLLEVWVSLEAVRVVGVGITCTLCSNKIVVWF